jgi:hypothetical protein
VWGEWSGAAPGLALTVRHEAWGERRFAHGEVRAASSARIEVSAPFGVKLALAATAFRVRRGESLYLADSEGSRLVLRSLSGSGERTRLELQAPAGRGRVRAALNLDERAPRTRAQWTLDWTRRTRASGAPRASP